MKQSIIYTLTPAIKSMDLDRLGNQIRVLVETIQFLQVEDKVDRDEVYKCWLQDINKTDNEKVFASYIHDLIQYGFLDKQEQKAPVNALVAAKKSVSKMTAEEKAELIAMLTA